MVVKTTRVEALVRNTDLVLYFDAPDEIRYGVYFDRPMHDYVIWDGRREERFEDVIECATRMKEISGDLRRWRMFGSLRTALDMGFVRW